MLLYKEKCLFDVQNVRFHIFVVAAELMEQEQRPTEGFCTECPFYTGIL